MSWDMSSSLWSTSLHPEACWVRRTKSSARRITPTSRRQGKSDDCLAQSWRLAGWENAILIFSSILAGGPSQYGGEHSLQDWSSYSSGQHLWRIVCCICWKSSMSKVLNGEIELRATSWQAQKSRLLSTQGHLAIVIIPLGAVLTHLLNFYCFSWSSILSQDHLPHSRGRRVVSSFGLWLWVRQQDTHCTSCRWALHSVSSSPSIFSHVCEALHCHRTFKCFSESYVSMVIDDLHCRVLVDSRMVGWMCLAVLFPVADSSGHVDLHAVPTCWLQQLCHCPQQSLQVTFTNIWFECVNLLMGSLILRQHAWESHQHCLASSYCSSSPCV